MRDCPSVEHLDTMEFHGVKTSVVTKCSGTADILPVPFAESRSAWLARCAGTRSVARGGGLHFFEFQATCPPYGMTPRKDAAVRKVGINSSVRSCVVPRV